MGRKKSENSASDLRDAAERIDGLGKSAILSLERAGYESLADLGGTSKQELMRVENIGPKLATRIQRFGDRTGIDNTDINTSVQNEASTRSTPKLSIEQLMNRIEEHYRSDGMEGGNWYRCNRTGADGNPCNTKVYFSQKSLTDLRKHEHRHTSQQGRDGSTEDGHESTTAMPSSTGGDILKDIMTDFDTLDR